MLLLFLLVTSDAWLRRFMPHDGDGFHFYDAAAPIIGVNTIDKEQGLSQISLW